MSALQLRASLLTWNERKQVRDFLRYKVGRATVKEVRQWVSPGPVGIIIQTALLTLLLLGLGALFFPLLFAALLAPVTMPLMIAGGRKRWLQLLPPEHDGDTVEMVE